jgi:hypothetical protein
MLIKVSLSQNDRVGCREVIPSLKLTSFSSCRGLSVCNYENGLAKRKGRWIYFQRPSRYRGGGDRTRTCNPTIDVLTLTFV